MADQPPIDPNKVNSKAAATDKVVEKGVGMAAVLMSLGTLTSRMLGLVRESAFAALFDKQITDAWAVAFRLPNIFRRLFGEGSLSVSFIPVFIETKYLAEKKNPLDKTVSSEATNLVSSFYSVLLIFLGVLTTLGIIFTPQILELLLDPVYLNNTEKLNLTIRMAQIMFGFIFLVSTYAFFMGLLNALGKFALAAVAPALWNVCMIISIFIPTHIFPSPGDGLAWGVIVGGILQTAILIPSLYRLGYLPRWKWNPTHPGVLKVLRNLLPGLLGTGLLQITTFINLGFASSLGEGVISYIGYVDRLIELPLSLIAVSLGTALLPRLSSLWAQDKKEQMSETANYFLRTNLFVSLPAAVGLMTLSYPVIELIFGRGHFKASDIQTTALILQTYGPIMIFSSCVRVITPSYYAVKNTWFPAVSSALGLLVHIILAPILMQKMHVQGLMISTMTSAIVNFFALLIGYNFFVYHFRISKLVIQFLKFLIPTAGVYAVCLLYPYVLQTLGDHFVGKLLSLFGVIAFAILVFAVLSYILMLEEFEQVRQVFARKVKAKLFKNK